MTKGGGGGGGDGEGAYVISVGYFAFQEKHELLESYELVK